MGYQSRGNTFPGATLTAPNDYTVMPGATRALNPFLALQERMSSLVTEVSAPLWYGSDDSAGGGSSGASNNPILISSSTANGGRGSYYFTTGTIFCRPGIGRTDHIDFAVPLFVKWKFFFQTALTTSAVFRQTVGHTAGNGGATTVLSQNGIGFGVVYKTATTGSVVLYTRSAAGGVLNTSTEVAVIDTTNTGISHEVLIDSDGTGNVSIFVDGATTANLTVSNGPSTEAGSNAVFNNDICLNGADGVNNQVRVYPILAGLKKN